MSPVGQISLMTFPVAAFSASPLSSVGGHRDLPADGHGDGTLAITESERIDPLIAAITGSYRTCDVHPAWGLISDQ